jgi:stage IV sporulation protein A
LVLRPAEAATRSEAAALDLVLFRKAESSQRGARQPRRTTRVEALDPRAGELRHVELDRVADALRAVQETGYGLVTPAMTEMSLQEPEIVRQGSRFGVKLKASAPSYHIMQVDVSAEVSPVMGAEQQSEEMVQRILDKFEGNPGGIWKTDMFGKSMHALVNEGLYNKLLSMPEDTQRKMRKTLSRIINEGKGGVICILL